MNNLKTFSYETKEIRTLLIDNQPWWVGKDVAEVLGYSNASKAVSMHVESEDKVMEMIPQSQNGNLVTQTSLINESGLYSLILSSKLPSAKKFKKWVTSEVLPDIRKQGMYMTPETLLNDPDVIIQMMTAYKDEKEKRMRAEEKAEIMKPKADYFDALVDRNLLTNLRDTAKELKIGQNKFIRWLIDNKYVYRDGGRIIKPYSQFTPELFEIKDFEKNGHVGLQTLITPKGKETFRMLYR